MKELSLLFIPLLFATNPARSQDTLHVPADYTTIQAAIDAANNGDVILVVEGTYYENVRLEDKSVTLASYFILDGDTSHISKTILNGSQPVNADNASVIMILDSPELNTICGFTLTGGLGLKKVFPDGSYSQAGGGICIEHSSADIMNNRIINNSITSSSQALGALGGGIFWVSEVVIGLTLKISGNLISGNEISGVMTGGGGIAIVNYLIGGELDYLIEENIIENNTVINTDYWKAMGGGIFLDFCLPTIGNQTIRNNIIRNNQAICNAPSKHSFGGGLYFAIRDTEVSGTVDNHPGPYVHNNIICGNHSDYLGGGVSVWRAYYIPGSQATPLQSAGNYVPKPSFINNTIVNNTAQDGSGFYIMNHIPFLMNNILWNEHPQSAVWGEVFLGDEPWWTSNVEPNNYGDARMFYNDIQGGWDADSGVGNSGYDPMFSDTLFHLSNNSHCVGNGIASVDINGVTYTSPSTDFYGNARPNPIDAHIDIGAIESPWIRGSAYAHDVDVSRQSIDTLRITAHVENPLAHTLSVVVTLSNGSGALIDSIFLADDGLHGDSTAGDGLWGYQYVPAQDDTMHMSIRTDDQTTGTSRLLPNAAMYIFTRRALISVDTRTVDFGRIDDSTPSRDTTFMVRNVGFSEDSLYVNLDYVNVTPDSAIAVSPKAFALARGDSAGVTFTVRPPLLALGYYNAAVLITSRFGSGQTEFSKLMLFQKVSPVDVAEADGLPTEFALEQNYPNPFNPSTTIQFAIPVGTYGRTSLRVYDVLGREVATLVNEVKQPGTYTVQFDARLRSKNSGGQVSGLTSGVYFYRLQARLSPKDVGGRAGSFVQTRKLLLLR